MLWDNAQVGLESTWRVREQTKGNKVQQHSKGQVKRETAGQRQPSSKADSNEPHSETTHTDTSDVSTGMDLRNNNRHGIFDVQTTAGMGAINTQLKANKTNIKATHWGRIVSAVIELESTSMRKARTQIESLKAACDENVQVCLFGVHYIPFALHGRFW